MAAVLFFYSIEHSNNQNQCTAESHKCYALIEYQCSGYHCDKALQIYIVSLGCHRYGGGGS